MLSDLKKAIGNAHGDKMVSKIKGFYHHSFQAYKQIFSVKAGPILYLFLLHPMLKRTSVSIWPWLCKCSRLGSAGNHCYISTKKNRFKSTEKIKYFLEFF